MLFMIASIHCHDSCDREIIIKLFRFIDFMSLSFCTQNDIIDDRKHKQNEREQHIFYVETFLCS